VSWAIPISLYSLSVLNRIFQRRRCLCRRGAGPVLCSDLPLFDELAGVIHRFPTGNVIALANKILQLAGDPVELNRYQASQEALVRRRAWPAVAREFATLVGERIDSYEAGVYGMSAIAAP
jgi:hypothetical protein